MPSLTPSPQHWVFPNTETGPPQPIDAWTLAYLAADLQQRLVGARVNRIQRLSHTDWRFTLWLRGQLAWVFHITPPLPCALLLADTDFYPAMAGSAGVTVLLKKHLLNATVAGVATVPGERLLLVRFRQVDTLGDIAWPVLILEALERHPNLILAEASGPDTPPEALRVVASVMGATQSRPLPAGAHYTPPPSPPGKVLFEASKLDTAAFFAWLEDMPEAQWVSALCQRYLGFGRDHLGQLLAGVDESKDVLARLQRLTQPAPGAAEIQPAMHPDGTAFCLWPTGSQPPLWQTFSDTQTLLATFAQPFWCNHALKILRGPLEKLIYQQQQRLQRRLAGGLPPEQQRGFAPDIWEQRGHCLLHAAALGQPQPPEAATQACLQDPRTGETLCMDINPTLSWAENAQEAFRLAKKAKAREVFLAQQQTVLAHQLAYLDTLAVLLAQATTAATCAAIAQDLSTAGLAKPVEKPKPTKKGGKKPAKLPPKPAGLLALTASDGARLWVGQSGHANALLAGTLGAPSDWWLHVHQMPGSHVLLRCAYAEILPPKTLWEAANLAVYFSAARHSANVPVVYTRHRFVRKIPASYPGHVTYREEKTVFVSVDEALVRRLLAQPRRE